MSGKCKIDPVEKVNIVKQYLNGVIGLRQASKKLGIAHQSIQNWIQIYKAEGLAGLLNQTKYYSYSKELKISAVNDYLNGIVP